MTTNNTNETDSGRRSIAPAGVKAFWAVCLGGLAVAIVANTARESSPGVLSAASSVTAETGPAQLARPLTSQLQPSRFPGVSVRSVDEKPGRRQLTLSHTLNKGWIYRVPGSKSTSPIPRSGNSSANSGNGYNQGSATGFTRKSGPGGSTITHFDPAYAPLDTFNPAEKTYYWSGKGASLKSHAAPSPSAPAKAATSGAKKVVVPSHSN